VALTAAVCLVFRQRDQAECDAVPKNDQESGQFCGPLDGIPIAYKNMTFGREFPGLQSRLD
jgi:Asp-tRNA(Asn)/Glu-tRNA(Gln) amidotransferase A subunit family amidase